MRRLTRWQRFRDSVQWRMTARGVQTCKGPIRLKPKERYRAKRVPEAWERYGDLIRAAARKYRVPVELFVTIIINESGLKPKSYQKYSGYVSDRKTPKRISVGLGAVLISTARYMLKDDSIDRNWLQDPKNAIRMIGVYLDRQYRITGFDPPKVAAAYNAGRLYRQAGATNHWKMRNYPIGSSVYIDHFVAVFDATMRYLMKRPDRPKESFAALFAGDPMVLGRVRSIPRFRLRRPSAVRDSVVIPTQQPILIGDLPVEAGQRRSLLERFFGRDASRRFVATRVLARLLD